MEWGLQIAGWQLPTAFDISFEAPSHWRAAAASCAHCWAGSVESCQSSFPSEKEVFSYRRCGCGGGGVTQAYQPPELDPSTSYAVAAVTQQQQRNAYNPF